MDDGPDGQSRAARNSRPIRAIAAEVEAASNRVGGLAGIGAFLVVIGGMGRSSAGDASLATATLVVGAALGSISLGWGIAVVFRAISVGLLALDREPAAKVAVEPTPSIASRTEDRRSLALVAFREAMAGDDWEAAEAAARRFHDDYPSDPIRPLDEMNAARTAQVDRLKAALDAARSAGDPDRILEIRDQLRPRLDHDGREAMDRELVGFLLRLIQRRLLGGTIAPDVADLAARIGEAFRETREGASLLASLPTLRRSAGLCPRCGKPYLGVEDACPECQATRPVAVAWPDDEEEDVADDQPTNPGPNGTTATN